MLLPLALSQFLIMQKLTQSLKQLFLLADTTKLNMSEAFVARAYLSYTYQSTHPS